MEPLLRNNEKNQLIGRQEFFNEYSRLTRASELELNADNTEIINIHDTNNKRLVIIKNELKKLDKVCYNNIDKGKINVLISNKSKIRIQIK